MKRILAIDDEEMCLDIISFALSSCGYEVITVDSGYKALELIQNENVEFDLILLDMMMPGLNGKETLIKIREKNRFKNIPVLFQTGATDTILQEKDNLYIISKPYKREDLISKIAGIFLKQANV